jgi:DNA-directed RNA polymerase
MENTTLTTHPNYPLQLTLERDMVGMGVEQFRKNLAKAKEQGRQSEAAHGVHLLRHCIEPLAVAIKGFVAEANTGKAGRRNIAARHLSLFEPEVAAFIIAKRLLDNLTDPGTVQRFALSVAQALEDEARFRFFKDENPAYFEQVRRAVEKRTPNREWRRKVMVHAMGKVELDWKPWPETDMLHLGIKALDLFIQTTGFAEIITWQAGRRVAQQVRPTAKLDEWVSRFNARCEVLTPAYLPTVIPPKPWAGAYGGGYYSPEVRPLPLVKTRRREYLEDLNHRQDEMPVVYEAINAMQNTAWRINTPVLEVLAHVWGNALPLGDLPARDDLPLPPKPANIDTDEAAREDWKRRAAKVYEANAKLRSKRLQVAKTIWIAEKFADQAELFFPYQLDFRGRCYAVPMFLNPQGPDYARGLLTFAKGKPINDETALGWLMIHGANCYGVDKVSFDERLAWVQENEDTILACAADPLGQTFWSKADSPWQFLAFCFEYAAFQAHGWGYVSSLPVQLDGTCNGLQHFSAMLRDPIGGAAVNLVPSDKPQDIYGRVAEVTTAHLRLIASTNGTNSLLAQRWVDFGVTRKMTKRPVMVLPYGGTMDSCKKYIFAAVKEEIAAGKANPFAEDELFNACAFLASVVWQSIGEVVVAARQAMGWLQKVASVAAKEGLPITWRTPVGFPVQQAYHDYTTKRVKTALGDSLIFPRMSVELPTLDKRRMANGISPNFVHSLDACALMIYVVTAKDNGIDSFSLIHDSYGTVAADAEMMAACLRHAFVTLYRDHDPLASFRKEIIAMLPDKQVAKLPLLPERGSLEIEAVIQSAYFFA